MSTDERAATVHRTGEGWEVRFRRRLAHRRDKVWRALTESEHLAHWLPCDIVGERRAGAPVELPFWPSHTERYGIEEPVLHGEIRVWEPPSVFEWTWDGDVLRWELAEDGGGTLLTFTTRTVPEPGAAAGTAAGFHVGLDHLEQWLDTGVPASPADADEATWQEFYTGAVAAAG